MPSLQINRPPLRHFLPQRPKWMLRLLRHRVTCRVLENSVKGMVPVLIPCVNRSAAWRGLVRVMALRPSVTHSPSAMGSVDL
ncbi:MAG: hypothetical protein ACYC67_06405 [Prosthecobacter sp.]